MNTSKLNSIIIHIQGIVDTFVAVHYMKMRKKHH